MSHQPIVAGSQVVAQWDYKATGMVMSNGDSDLTFQKGDKMVLIEECPNDWLRVKFNESVGVIPRSYIKIYSPPRQLAEALWNYKSTQVRMSTGDYDLSFKKGEKMVILEEYPNSWMRVRLNGKIGVVPSNYVKKISPPPDTQQDMRHSGVPDSPDGEQSRLYRNTIQKSSSESKPSSHMKQTQMESPSKDIRRSISSTNVRDSLKESEDITGTRTVSPSSRSKMMKVLGVSGNTVDEIHQRKSPQERSSFVPYVRLSMKVVLPPDYAFAEEDSEENILFVEKSEQIRAATITKLVERLTHAEYADPDYLWEFLLTYRSFTTPKELIDYLLQRFNLPTPEDIKQNESECAIFERTVLKPIRLRVFNVLKKWTSDHWYDFEEHPALIEEVKVFTTLMREEGMANSASAIEKIVTRQLEGKEVDSLRFSKTPPEPHEVDMKVLSGVSSQTMVLAFHPEEVARQLTLIDFELFAAIKPTEFLGQAWTKKDKQERAPNILAMIQRFNKVSMWVTSALVQIDNLKIRSEVLIRFIDIATHLRNLNNYNGVMEVLAGLRSSAVHRLKRTWATLPKEKLKTFEELLAILSPDSNFFKLRRHLHTSISPPCIPYLGMYLTDLTFIEDGNPDSVQDLINFDKRRRIAAVIKEVKQYQQESYPLTVVPIMKGYLLAGGEYVDQNKCYQLSLTIEPRVPKGGKPVKEKEKSSRPSWRKSAAVKKKEELLKQAKLDLYTLETKDSPESSPSTSRNKSVRFSSESDGDEKKGKGELIGRATEVSMDDLVESLREGNAVAVDQYIDSLDKTPEEKEEFRNQVDRYFEEKMKEMGVIPIDIDEETYQVPFEMLTNYLAEGNSAAFEAYFEGLEIYEAERIREQALKMYEEISQGAK